MIVFNCDVQFNLQQICRTVHCRSGWFGSIKVLTVQTPTSPPWFWAISNTSRIRYIYIYNMCVYMIINYIYTIYTYMCAYATCVLVTLWLLVTWGALPASQCGGQDSHPQSWRQHQRSASQPGLELQNAIGSRTVQQLCPSSIGTWTSMERKDVLAPRIWNPLSSLLRYLSLMLPNSQKHHAYIVE